MGKSSVEVPHEPLFVLRQHHAPVLSCSFYPTYVSCGYPSSHPKGDKGSEKGTHELVGPTDNSASHWVSHRSATTCSFSYAHYFLTGDADGVCILWDLRSRKPLLSFDPVLESERQNKTKENEKSTFVSHPTTNRGVLSVGFFPSNILVKVDQVVKENLLLRCEDHDSIAEDVLSHSCAEFFANENKVRFLSASASATSNDKLTESTTAESKKKNAWSSSTREIGLKQRFGLNRYSRTVQNGASERPFLSPSPSSTTPNLKEAKCLHSTNKQSRVCGKHEGLCSHSVFFFTQCRNQELYIWELRISGGFEIEESENESNEGDKKNVCNGLNSNSCLSSTSFSGVFHPLFLSLLYVLPSPQCGFCQISCAYTYVWRPVSCFSLSLSRCPPKNEKNRTCSLYEVSFFSYFTIPQEGPDGVVHIWCAYFLPDISPLSCATSFCSSNTCSQLKIPQLNGSSSPSRLVLISLNHQRNWKEVSLARTFKGGMIMNLHMNRNCASLAGAFESGHVSLFQYRCTSKECRSVDCWRLPQTARGSEKDDDNLRCNDNSSGMSSSCGFEPHVVAVLRAFAEPCVSCFWEPDSFWWRKEWKFFDGSCTSSEIREEKNHGSSIPSTTSGVVVAASAEGTLHCYQWDHWGKMNSFNSKMEESNTLPQETVREWSLRWSVRLSRGIGQLFVQGEVVVIGCWDNTVRILSLITGKMVSILPHHRDAVSGLAVCEATLYFIFRAFSVANHRTVTTSHTSFPMDLKEDGRITVSHCDKTCQTDVQVNNEEVGRTIFKAIAHGALQALASFGFDIHYMRNGDVDRFRGGTSVLQAKTETGPDSSSCIHMATSQGKCGGEVVSLQSHTLSTIESSEMCIHFASVSKDLTVALWNIDFKVLKNRSAFAEGSSL